jgi:hypothetical protein
MQSRIQRKPLLQSHIVSSRGTRRDEYQVPAVHRNRAWNGNEFVRAQELVAVVLLSGAGNSRLQPVGIGQRLGFDNPTG